LGLVFIRALRILPARVFAGLALRSRKKRKGNGSKKKEWSALRQLFSNQSHVMVPGDNSVREAESGRGLELLISGHLTRDRSSLN